MVDQQQTLMMKPNDNVAVALTFMQKTTVVQVVCQDQIIPIELKDDIEFGHKFAVVMIRQGEDVKKYGEVIGSASSDIHSGEHVHIHNVEGKRGRGDKGGPEPNAVNGL